VARNDQHMGLPCIKWGEIRGHAGQTDAWTRPHRRCGRFASSCLSAFYATPLEMPLGVSSASGALRSTSWASSFSWPS
jgi:hypothetical protein